MNRKPPQALSATRGLVLTWILVVCTGCSSAEGNNENSSSAAARRAIVPESVLVGDRSTPDRAIESYWRMQRMADSIGNLPPDTTTWEYRQQQVFVRTHRRFFSGTALADILKEDSAATYSREITNVDMQTDTRAIVTVRIRNTSPIPPGAVVEDWHAKERRDGDEYRYHMEKHPDGWKITQVESWEDYNKAWRSLYGRPPTVPTWTSAF